MGPALADTLDRGSSLLSYAGHGDTEELSDWNQSFWTRGSHGARKAFGNLTYPMATPFT